MLEVILAQELVDRTAVLGEQPDQIVVVLGQTVLFEDKADQIVARKIINKGHRLILTLVQLSNKTPETFLISRVCPTQIRELKTQMAPQLSLVRPGSQERCQRAPRVSLRI